MAGQYYNIEDGTGAIHRVLVKRSIQYDPYTRHLTVTRSGGERMTALTGPLHVAPPTPYHPRAIFHTADGSTRTDAPE